jgi:hypothetical protein
LSQSSWHRTKHPESNPDVHPSCPPTPTCNSLLRLNCSAFVPPCCSFYGLLAEAYYLSVECTKHLEESLHPSPLTHQTRLPITARVSILKHRLGIITSLIALLCQMLGSSKYERANHCLGGPHSPPREVQRSNDAAPGDVFPLC